MFARPPILAVAFAGLKTDADTVIVQAVNWLLLTNSEIRIHVVSSDHLLRQRCTHELPTCRGEPFGEKRPRDQLSRISFEDSLSFGKCLDAARHPSPTDTFAASPLRRARQPSLSDGDTATMSKGARRRAKHRAEKRVMGSADERTYQRERAALELHERVDHARLQARADTVPCPRTVTGIRLAACSQRLAIQRKMVTLRARRSLSTISAATHGCDPMRRRHCGPFYCCYTFRSASLFS